MKYIEYNFHCFMFYCIRIRSLCVVIFIRVFVEKKWRSHTSEMSEILTIEGKNKIKEIKIMFNNSFIINLSKLIE